MATPILQADAVKAAISSGIACPSTVTTLQSLLSSEDSTSDAKQATAAKRTVSAASRTAARSTARSSSKQQPVEIHKDAPIILTPKERYVFATETVNLTLKALVDAQKTNKRPPPRRASSAAGKAPSPLATPRSTSISQRVLQPRIGNMTSSRQSPDKACKTPLRTCHDVVSDQSVHIVAIAECARLAFAFLRSVNYRKLGVRELAKFQLETGMVALVGKLIAHGLESLALKELRLVKLRIEAMSSEHETGQPSSRSKPSDAEKETMATLLHLNANIAYSPESVTLAISYQLHVLKVIANSRKPGVIDTLPHNLSLDRPNSVANLSQLQASQPGMLEKATGQLEGLAQIILGLCPSVSPNADEIATNHAHSTTPTAAFRLQTIALQIRKIWWKLAGHSVDHGIELVEPLAKCLSAYSRRCGSTGEEIYRQTIEAYDLLLHDVDVSQHGVAFGIHRTLSCLANSVGLFKDAAIWASRTIEDCADLEPTHARRLACSIQQVVFASLDGEDAEGKARSHAILLDIKTALGSPITGRSTDYELLLLELLRLTRLPSWPATPGSDDGTTLRRMLTPLVAGFCQRYVRSYPGKHVNQAQAILSDAVRRSRTSDDLVCWITEDAAKVFISNGTFRLVADLASKCPLDQAWSSNSTAMTLGRVLHALVLKTVRSGVDICKLPNFENEGVSTAESACVLEWQIQYALELAERPKYQLALQKLIPDMLQKMSKLYTAAEYPIRRARFTSQVLRFRERHSQLLPPDIFKIWQDPSPLLVAQLGNDTGLQMYLADVKASVETVKAFVDRRPGLVDIKSNLAAWQRIIDNSTTLAMLRDQIDNPENLAQQLSSVAAYLAVEGHDAACLPVLRLIARLRELDGASPDDQCSSMVAIARKYLMLGFSEKAGHVLAQARALDIEDGLSDVARLQLHVAYAEYFVAIDNMCKARASFDDARNARVMISLDRVKREDRRTFEMLHAQGWLVQSRFLLQSGSPHAALAAAKRSVRFLNTVWGSIERSEGILPPSSDESPTAASTDVNGLTVGLSKLELSSRTASQANRSNEMGAAFWGVVSPLCTSFTHLSDVYAHHGLFTEANYYSQQAVRTAQSVQSARLIARMKCHRSQLLTLAGQLDEAELCLAGIEDGVVKDTTMTRVQWHLAKAAIRLKEGSFKEAAQLFHLADQVIQEMQCETFVKSFETLKAENEPADLTTGAAAINSGSEEVILCTEPAKKVTAKSTRGRKAPAPKMPARSATNRARTVSKTSKPAEKAHPFNPYILGKLRANVLLEKILASIHMGMVMEPDTSTIKQLCSCIFATLRQRRALYRSLMQKAAIALQKDFTLSILPESTLSFPAVVPVDRMPLTHDGPRSSLSSPAQRITTTTVTKTVRSSSRKVVAEETFSDILMAARECLVNGHQTSIQYGTTFNTHSECSMLSNATMLLSAAGLTQPNGMLHPVREALHIDLPRINALQYEMKAQSVEDERTEYILPLPWPSDSDALSNHILDAAMFQEQYIDILPKTWTAVSISLNEDGTELYIARYRCGQSPLILRLPFSRHKPDGDEDGEAFDFGKGKAELLDIIQASNYSCHNSGGVETKHAKSNWWSERESLDRRLHELLINMENIWLGGFKGVLSSLPRHADLLARFRKSFDDILARYLPSRQTSKSKKKPLALDNKVLELFVGLGDDRDGIVDLDEPLADLLYFVVDMLQFNGEHNAYDEIDFDSMTVDVADALRAYCEAAPGDENGVVQHLILVLDKRLQVFPWESMPFLDGVSVSRVGSMLSIRDRLLAMRQPASDDDEDRYIVSREGGTYILNPSSDLASTQTTLLPSLSNLTNDNTNLPWTSIINRAPTEPDFTTALSTSPILLYFGHGAGSQYIRPRTIKKLPQCSEVVWLIGCSSGAVTEHGDLEPFAVPAAYLLAGGKATNEGRCMAVVATLWDVTDKDIDRFSLAMGEEWGLWPSSETSRLPPAKTPRKLRVGEKLSAAVPSTPQRQQQRVPKTPKARKTPASLKTPARSRSRSQMRSEDGGRKRSLVEAVARSREACYLRYLNGAAAVVYGVPVYLGE